MKFSDKDNSPKILFETNHFLLAYKPAGWVVPIENEAKQSLEGFLVEHLKKTLGKTSIFLKPIHRLDKPVAGLVLFARSSKGLSRLQQFQREKRFEKFYVAEVEGVLSKSCGKLVHKLEHGDFRAHVRENGKPSTLYYRTVKRSKTTTLVSIKLITGRYHQIRAQFHAIGHPIVGDERYALGAQKSSQAIKLTHTHLLFPDPITQLKRSFKLRRNIL